MKSLKSKHDQDDSMGWWNWPWITNRFFQLVS